MVLKYIPFSCRTYSQPKGYITIKHPRDMCIGGGKRYGVRHGTHVEILSQIKWQNLFSFNWYQIYVLFMFRFDIISLIKPWQRQHEDKAFRPIVCVREICGRCMCVANFIIFGQSHFMHTICLVPWRTNKNPSSYDKQHLILNGKSCLLLCMRMHYGEA